MYPRHYIDTALTFVAPMVDESDNESEETGLTLAVTAANMDDSSMTSVTPDATTNLGNGIYRITLPATTFDVEGVVVIRVSATGANIFRTAVMVYDPTADTTVPGWLGATIYNKIADHVLRRTAANVIASSDGDAAVSSKFNQTVLSVVLGVMGFRAQSGSTFQFSETSGGTVRADWTATGTTTTPTVPTEGG